MAAKRSLSKAKSHDSEVDLKRIERLTSQVWWFITIGIAVFGILSSILIALILSRSTLPSKEDVEKLGRRYDPIFRKVLMDKAYTILSDVHLTEIKTQPELIQNIIEIKNSLEMIGAFDNRNKGLLRIFELLLSLSNEDNSIIEHNFLSIDPLRDKSLDMIPQESSFFLTFQGLLYLKNMRNEKDIYKYDYYLNEAKSKFAIAQRLNIGISNMWNGLGICFLEDAHNKKKLDLIPKARDFFQLAYELHRSPINLAAEINNLSYANMIVAFYNSFKIIISEESGHLFLTFEEKKQIEEMRAILIKELQAFDRALTYEPNAVSILLSKAECLCNLGLCFEAADLACGDEITFKNTNMHLERAMEIIREAQLKGFSDWPYLFSRIWISNTLLRIEKYREELISFLEP